MVKFFPVMKQEVPSQWGGGYLRLSLSPSTWILLLRSLGLAIILFFCIQDTVIAKLAIDVSRGYTQPMPIAIANLLGTSKLESQLGHSIANVISADLERSGLFRPITVINSLKKIDSLRLQPMFSDMKALNTQALLSGQINIGEKGDIRLEFSLWELSSRKKLVQEVLFASTEHWRRVAHVIADSIYTYITGEDSYFNTRVAYIAESGLPTHRIKRLAIMDQDGANHRYLSEGSWLVLTPRFSPTMHEITYMSYFRNVPQLYLLDIETGKRKLLGAFPGMTFAPCFSPDGSRMIMSMAQQGNSDIYEMDLRTRDVRQLTNHPAIDTSPSYSADGLRITFNSDRSGTQQIYVMNKDGSDVQRISFGDGRYATSVWSPRGDLIAFTKFKSGRFYIGVMRPDGSGERQLAEGFLVESPTWAPNGRVLMFCREIARDVHGGGGSTRLYSVDLTGYNERLVATPQDASDPSWSPLLSLQPLSNIF